MKTCCICGKPLERRFRKAWGRKDGKRPETDSELNRRKTCCKPECRRGNFALWKAEREAHHQERTHRPHTGFHLDIVRQWFEEWR